MPERKIYWKTEGPTDLIALVSLGLPEGHEAMSNVFGATETPEDWMPTVFAGADVFVIHDADVPGQAGATMVKQSGGKDRAGWAPAIATQANSCRNVMLPYEVAQTKGKDLRDWINEQLDAGLSREETYQKLLEMAWASPTVEPMELPEPEEESVESDDDPHRLAKVNLAKYEKFGRTLRYWRGSWYSYRGTHYQEIDKDHLVARMNMSIKEEFDRIRDEKHERYVEWKKSPGYDPDQDKGPPKSQKVTESIVKNVYAATKGMRLMPQSVDLHSWLNDGPENCVSCQNGILNIGALVGDDEGELLMDHCPEWFSTVTLPYDYQQDADCPLWKAFLVDIFDGDAESIAALQMWMGYLLVKSDNFLNKVMFIIGKPRSGKGTILKIIRAVLGEQNIATPTLSGLAEKWALESLVGKSAALVADARLSARSDETVITERLLSISGNDPQDIQRKYRGTLTGYRLNVRFTLFSNLLPRLQDVSSAFVTRCIFLHTPNSYLGREDVHLYERLEGELSGILNWCIAGRMMLKEARWRIEQPQTGLSLVHEMDSIISPAKIFLRDRCVVEQSVECKTAELFNLWIDWCNENDIANPGTIQTFSRKIKAVEPRIDTYQKRIAITNDRYRVFVNVREKSEEELKEYEQTN